jgi:Fe2+ transport system protein FeoA
MSLGFLPMENVCVRKKSKRASGVYIVQVDNALFGLRSEEAKQVLVDQL